MSRHVEKKQAGFLFLTFPVLTIKGGGGGGVASGTQSTCSAVPLRVAFSMLVPHVTAHSAVFDDNIEKGRCRPYYSSTCAHGRRAKGTRHRSKEEKLLPQITQQHQLVLRSPFQCRVRKLASAEAFRYLYAYPDY